MTMKWLILLTVLSICLSNEAPQQSVMIGDEMTDIAKNEIVNKEIEDFKEGKSSFNQANIYLLMRKTLGEINEDEYEAGLKELDMAYTLMTGNPPPIGFLQEINN
ncbi:unnamed protein product [Blepharisma stoltei]|uniref:Uncharacterized protein n=1 Tax=Blepharisma stoltei TaxID=1481888 RepID=A0AAU9K329_9CILI|nr:unnamed protein product [Blepharisma stoltei]